LKGGYASVMILKFCEYATDTPTTSTVTSTAITKKFLLCIHFTYFEEFDFLPGPLGDELIKNPTCRHRSGEASKINTICENVGKLS
jgi:hypothetical protein